MIALFSRLKMKKILCDFVNNVSSILILLLLDRRKLSQETEPYPGSRLLFLIPRTQTLISRSQACMDHHGSRDLCTEQVRGTAGLAEFDAWTWMHHVGPRTGPVRTPRPPQQDSSLISQGM